MNDEAKKYIDSGINFGFFEPEKAIDCFNKAISSGVDGILVYRLMASVYTIANRVLTPEEINKAKYWLSLILVECTSDGAPNDKYQKLVEQNYFYQTNLSAICYDLANLYHREGNCNLALKYYFEALKFLTKYEQVFNQDEWTKRKCVQQISDIMKSNPRYFVDTFVPQKIEVF
jgi:hypothetical protein